MEETEISQVLAEGAEGRIESRRPGSIGRRATWLLREPQEEGWGARQPPPPHRKSQLELVSEAPVAGTTQHRRRK